VEAGFWLGSSDVDVVLIAGLTKLHRSWKKGKNKRSIGDETVEHLSRRKDLISDTL